MIQGDTIAAIATAPGRGGVAVVRVSGPDAFVIAEKLTGKPVEPGRVAVRSVRSIRSKRSTGIDPIDLTDLIDEGVLLSFKAPRSYTGEDVVEFQCHGGTVVPRRILAACLAAGARLANRGEFTSRAFLNGKLDYDQAESVLDLVDAKTERAADLAFAGLKGRKRKELRALYDFALGLSTDLEHALDVDEGDLPADFPPAICARLTELENRLREALRHAREGRLLRTGALVVLAGPPNAGKSSLMNALLEESRAIVSDVPGTTRDSIEESFDLDGWPVRLVDTAGLRETGDAIEAEGVKRSEELMAKADIVVWLKSCKVEKLKGAQAVNLSTSQLIVIHPKCDLGRGEGLNVSAKTGEGLDELKRAIVAKLEAKVAATDAGDDPSADAVAIAETLSVLRASCPVPRAGTPCSKHAARSTEHDLDLVLTANAVRAVAARLGSAVGATYSADMLDNLFSRFCVGK